MREILFRGKRLDNGEWIEGAFVKKLDPLIGTPSYFIVGQGTSMGMLDPLCTWYIVDPATVGQYTGLTDKNGKKIFEGDILQVDIFTGGHDRCIVGFGEFEPFCHYGTEQVGFYLYWQRDKQAFQKYANIGYWLRVKKAICIGNIHDNPELMKGGAPDGI